jgi:hypothetical protein
MSLDWIDEIARRFDKLKNRRYPTLLIIPESIDTISNQVMKAAADRASGKYVDYLKDILGGPNPPVLGAYDRQDFREWLKSEAAEAGTLFVNHADPLLSTWRESDQRAFFIDFLHIESNVPDSNQRAPIVLLSPMASLFQLPEETLGQGIVWYT